MLPLEKSVVQLPLLGGDSRHSLPCLVILASSPQAVQCLVLASHSCSCVLAGFTQSSARSVWEVVTLCFITSFAFLGLARERGPEPTPMARTGIAQQGAHAGHSALWFVRRELFGEGGGFSQ